MKKFIYTLILILLVATSVPLFTACDKEKSYNLNNFKTDFYSVATSCSVIEKNGQYLVVDYSTVQMSNLIATVDNYKNLDRYQVVLNNSLDFVYANLELLSNNNLQISTSSKNKLESALNEFIASFDNLETNVTALVDLAQVNGDDAGTSLSCINRVGLVAESYLNTINKALALSEVCENIYFDELLTDPNPDVRNMSLANFSPSDIIIRLPERLHAQIVALTRNFVKTQIELVSLADGIKLGTSSLDLSKDNYINNVNLINKTFVEQTAVNKANANKQNFYNYSLVAFNYQASLKNGRDKTENAYSNYGVDNIAQPTYVDTLNKSIIDNDLIILKNYNGVLANMLNIILGE